MAATTNKPNGTALYFYKTEKIKKDKVDTIMINQAPGEKMKPNRYQRRKKKKK